MQSTENMPAELKPCAEAALAWINQTQQTSYQLTGIVDYQDGLTAQPGQAYEFGLVLCDGEICTREQIRVEPAADGYAFSPAEVAARDIPPLLDPPAGIRNNWLAGELAKHEFVLLLFYRGLW